MTGRDAFPTSGSITSRCPLHGRRQRPQRGHRLVLWSFTLPATSPEAPTSKRPQACPVEFHAARYIAGGRPQRGHRLVLWNFTLPATSPEAPTSKRPQACPVEFHAARYIAGGADLKE